MLQRLFKRHNTDPTAAGAEPEYYSTFAEAFSKCDGKAYENPELCAMIADKTSRYKTVLQEKPYKLIPSQTFFMAVFFDHLRRTGKRSVTIADLGGACGTHYFELKRFLEPDFKLNWIVIETEAMTAAARSRNLQDQELQFITSLKQLEVIPDILHSSSTLQYVPDPYETLNDMIGIGAPVLFFNRMIFTDGPSDLVSVQSSMMSANGPGPMPEGYVDRRITYPHTLLSFQRFQSPILKKYTCNWMVDEPSGNIMNGKENISGKGLYYSKLT